MYNNSDRTFYFIFSVLTQLFFLSNGNEPRLQIFVTDLQSTLSLDRKNFVQDNYTKWNYCMETCNYYHKCDGQNNWNESPCTDIKNNTTFDLSESFNCLIRAYDLPYFYKGDIRLKAINVSAQPKCKICLPDCKATILSARIQLTSSLDKISNYSAPILQQLQKNDTSVSVNARIPIKKLCKLYGTINLYFFVYTATDNSELLQSQRQVEEEKLFLLSNKTIGFDVEGNCIGRMNDVGLATFSGLTSSTDYKVETYYSVPLHNSGNKQSKSSFLIMRTERNMLVDHIVLGLTGLVLFVVLGFIIWYYEKLRRRVAKSEIPNFLKNEKNYLDHMKSTNKRQESKTNQKEKVDKFVYATKHEPEMQSDTSSVDTNYYDKKHQRTNSKNSIEPKEINSASSLCSEESGVGTAASFTDNSPSPPTKFQYLKKNYYFDQSSGEDFLSKINVNQINGFTVYLPK